MVEILVTMPARSLLSEACRAWSVWFHVGTKGVRAQVRIEITAL